MITKIDEEMNDEVKNTSTGYLDNFLEMLSAEKSATINTILSYKLDLEGLLRFIEQVEGFLNIQSLDEEVITQYLDHLFEQKLSNASIARKICAIRQFCTFLVREKILKYNKILEVEGPKIDHKIPELLSEEVTSKILSFAKSDKTLLGIRTAAMVEILCATGILVSELISLQMDMIDLAAGTIKLGGKGAKTRMLVLSEEAVKALRDYMLIRARFITDNAEERVTLTQDNEDEKKKCCGFFHLQPKLARLLI